MLEITVFRNRAFIEVSECTGERVMNKCIGRKVTVVSLCSGAFVALEDQSANAQWQGLCQNGHWVTSGYANVCVPDQPTPQFQPQYQPPQPSNNIYNNPLTREAIALGAMIMKDAPLPENVPLSSGLVMMQNTQAPAPVPAPANYVDPFVPSPSPGVGAVKLNPDLGNAVTLQPPAEFSQPVLVAIAGSLQYALYRSV